MVLARPHLFEVIGGMREMKRHPDFPNYSVTKDGRVWSGNREGSKGGWLKNTLRKSGYLHVHLRKNAKTYNCRVHRLVLETFVGLCPDGMECRHLNGDPADNRLENLCWGTRSENMYDKVRHGTHPKSSLGKYGEKHPKSKISDQDRRLMFSVYHDGAYTQQELAEHFGVCQRRVCVIVNDSRWGV